jgi:hypothetical protein
MCRLLPFGQPKRGTTTHRIGNHSVGMILR